MTLREDIKRLAAQLKKNRPNLVLPGKAPGTKIRLMPKLLPYIPRHDHHVVVFGCLGGELMGWPVSKNETFNDVNRDVINFFQVLRTDLEGLCAAIELHPASEEIFYEKRRLLQSDESDPFERAFAFAYVANLSRGDADATVNGDSLTFCVSYRTLKVNQRWLNLPTILQHTADRFRNVQLLNWDFSKVMQRFNHPENLLTIDPPYHPETLCTITPMYRHELTHEQHVDLLFRARNLKAKAMIFHPPCSGGAIFDSTR